MAAPGVGALATAAGARAADPWADHVRSFDAGTTPTPGYADPQSTLGAPERFTGEAFGFDAVVSMFNPPFGPEELYSIGEGGRLELEFDEPITNSPDHLFGADFIVFGNGGFVDVNFPNGQIGSPPATFGTDRGMRISLSEDGVHYVPLVQDFEEGFFPAQGWLDAGPYATTAGSVPTDFTRPMNPGLTLDDFSGLSFSQALTLYDGSGGGTPIDIFPSGLSAVRFVRIEVLDDGDPQTQQNIEIDAIATVPEPAAAWSMGIVLAFRRRRARGVCMKRTAFSATRGVGIARAGSGDSRCTVPMKTETGRRPVPQGERR